MNNALGWEPVAGYPALHVRVDDFSIQISSSTSKTFFVRLLTDWMSDELVFSDFNHTQSETFLATNAIVVLCESYDIDFAEKVIRVRAPHVNGLGTKSACVATEWPQVSLRSLENGLRKIGVSILDSNFAGSPIDPKDLLIRTVKR